MRGLDCSSRFDIAGTTVAPAVLVELDCERPDPGNPPEGSFDGGPFIGQDVTFQSNDRILNLHVDHMGMPHHMTEFGAHALPQHVIGNWSAQHARALLRDHSGRTPFEVHTIVPNHSICPT